ncbi:hypothetical protein RclHR1_11820001 [Rhizophagus clarus]|uniref:Integrase catalytic domain-containing protein n=1 Tax=Rhizophagus clarus TaxID=94130 RepID=A0A2Z6Q5G2_9GLOM|nr:hypothetical protein RclHR1_11820001 [Rhizophagus clarus]
MPAQLLLLPIISIDSGEARNLDISIALKKIYYQPIGYYRNAKKLHKASLKTGYIPCASFTSITIPNEVYQADVLYMPYDKHLRKFMMILKFLWSGQNYLITDKGSEFRGDCEKLMREHIVKIQKAKSKLTMVVENINNSITRQIGISPVEAIKKEEVFAKPSYSCDGPISFDEKKLSSNVLVCYLLYSSDLKGGRRHAGNLNWFPHIYHIRQSMVQKNQPVLYWLKEIPFGLTDNNYVIKHPERSFVQEELMVIPFDTELLLQ